MADISKTIKSVRRQESSSNKLFDATNALIRNVRNAGTDTAALDTYQGQIGELNNKIQQQLAVLNTLKGDLSAAGIDTSSMDQRMANESVNAFIDLMQERLRELNKLPASISVARAAARQAAATPAPSATSTRSKRGEKVNTGPPVTTSFDPDIAEAAAAEAAAVAATPAPSPSPVVRAAAARRSSAPKPAAPPPAPAPPPTTLGPKFSVISREEAMAGSVRAAPPPRPPKPPKPAKPPARPAAPPPTIPPISGGTTTGGEDEEDDDTLTEAFGPYGPGFSRRKEASRLRALGETLGPQVAAITARGGFAGPDEETSVGGTVRGFRQSAGLFRTTFGVGRYHARASQLEKEFAGVPTTLGDPTARNRFQHIEDRYRSMLGSPMHPDDVFAFGEQVRQERAGLVQDTSLNPQQRGQLMQQLSGYETGIRNLGNVTPIAPGGRGSALAGQSLTGVSVAQGIYARNQEIGRGGFTDTRREELRDQITAGRELLQITERRLRMAHEEAELEGRVTREMQHQYESAQREVGALSGRLTQQEKDLGSVRTTGTTRGHIEDMFEGRAPSLGQAILNYRNSTGRSTGTMASSMLNAMNHPLGFGMGIANAGGIATGRGIAGAMGATSTEALGLGGAAGSFAAIPVAGAIAGVIALIMGQVGNAVRHGSGVENLYRRGGQAGTGAPTIGANFTQGFLGDILGAGNASGYSRDQTLGLAQQLASAGMNRSNVLNGARVSGAMAFSRQMGVNVEETGASLAAMQRLGIGRGEGGQERLLGLIAQSISQGGMQGRESEVLQSVTRLTTTLAERGVAQDMRGGFGQTTAMLDLFNRSGNPALMGQFGANVLSRMDQGIQGATGYKDAFLFNEYNRQAGGSLDPFTYQYRKAAGVNDPGAFQAMTDLVKFSGGSQRGGVALNEQFNLGSPLIGLQIAQMIESGQVSQETLAGTVQRLKTGGLEGAAAGVVGGTQSDLGTYEHLGQSLNTLTNEFENWASGVAGPIDIITNGLSKLAGALTYVMNFTQGVQSTGNDPFLDAWNGATGRNDFRPNGARSPVQGVTFGSPAAPGAAGGGRASSAVARGNTSTRDVSAGLTGLAQVGLPGVGRNLANLTGSSGAWTASTASQLRSNPSLMVPTRGVDSDDYIAAFTAAFGADALNNPPDVDDLINFTNQWVADHSDRLNAPNEARAKLRDMASAWQQSGAIYSQDPINGQGGHGSTVLNSANDCSGFVSDLLRQSGVLRGGNLNTGGLRNASQGVGRDQARVGDIVVSNANRDPVNGEHTGIIVDRSNGKGLEVAHMTSSGNGGRGGVMFTPLDEFTTNRWMGNTGGSIRRMPGSDAFGGGGDPSRIMDQLATLGTIPETSSPSPLLGGLSTGVGADISSDAGIMALAQQAAPIIQQQSGIPILPSQLAGLILAEGRGNQAGAPLNNPLDLSRSPRQEAAGVPGQRIGNRNWRSYNSMLEGAVGWGSFLTNEDTGGLYSSAVQGFQATGDYGTFLQRVRQRYAPASDNNEHWLKNATDNAERFRQMGADVLPESSIFAPMGGQDLAASQQMMAMNIKMDNPTITIQLPDGSVVGTATLNPRQDAVDAVDRSPISFFGGSA